MLAWQTSTLDIERSNRKLYFFQFKSGVSDHLSAQRPERKCDVIKMLSFSTVSRKIVLTQTKRWHLKMCERRVPGVRIVQTQEQVHLCEFGKTFIAAEPSARKDSSSPTLPNLPKWARSQAIEDGAKRNDQTKFHSPTLSIFDNIWPMEQAKNSKNWPSFYALFSITLK